MVGTKLWLGIITSSALGLAAGCSKSAPNPTSPSAARPGGTGAAADGSTLKVTAPTPQSPVNNQQVTANEVRLVVANASATFGTAAALTYRFEIFNVAGARVYSSPSIAGGSSGTTFHLVPSSVALEGDKRHDWRARAEFEGEDGPWSSSASFIAPNATGYIRGNELYDPLINGETVGTPHGPLTFIPGVGVKLESQLSYISYELPRPLLSGEFSILVTGLSTNSEGHKSKLFAMGEGYGDIVTNNRRMTVEKRGDPAGVVAWRFISHQTQIETIGAERVRKNFDENRHYFWQASWRNNFFNLRIREDGVNGNTMYNFGKPFDGAYDPSPHVIYVGAPVGRSGPLAASVDHVIIRQVWVSERPRPGFANR